MLRGILGVVGEGGGYGGVLSGMFMGKFWGMLIAWVFGEC